MLDVRPGDNDQDSTATWIAQLGRSSTQRGVRAAGASTVTSTMLGTLPEDARSRQEFFALTDRSA